MFRIVFVCLPVCVVFCFLVSLLSAWVGSFPVAVCLFVFCLCCALCLFVSVVCVLCCLVSLFPCCLCVLVCFLLYVHLCVVCVS